MPQLEDDPADRCCAPSRKLATLGANGAQGSNAFSDIAGTRSSTTATIAHALDVLAGAQVGTHATLISSRSAVHIAPDTAAIALGMWYARRTDLESV